MPQETHEDKDEDYYNQIIARLYREPLLSQAAAAKKKQVKVEEDNAKTAGQTEQAASPEFEENKPGEKETKVNQTEEQTSPISFNVPDDKPDNAEPLNATLTPDGQKAQPEGREERETSSTEDTPRPKAPSFLDKLKQHLKKGLTDFTRDFDE
jgi:hypothetical protein